MKIVLVFRDCHFQSKTIDVVPRLVVVESGAIHFEYFIIYLRKKGENTYVEQDFVLLCLVDTTFRCNNECRRISNQTGDTGELCLLLSISIDVHPF